LDYRIDREVIMSKVSRTVAAGAVLAALLLGWFAPQALASTRSGDSTVSTSAAAPSIFKACRVLNKGQQAELAGTTRINDLQTASPTGSSCTFGTHVGWVLLVAGNPGWKYYEVLRHLPGTSRLASFPNGTAVYAFVQTGHNVFLWDAHRHLLELLQGTNQYNAFALLACLYQKLHH
jgi:hypothetical protein